MSDMISRNDYEKSVLLAVFLKGVKDGAAEKESITDVLFTPVIGGYEISFLNGGTRVVVAAEVRGFFTKRLIIKKFVDGKVTAAYRARSKEEVSFCAEQALSE